MLRSSLTALATVLVCTSCVSQKKYNNAMDQLTDRNLDVLALETENDHLQVELALTDSEVVELYDTLYDQNRALARAEAEAWYLRRMERRIKNQFAPMMADGDVVLERREGELALVFTDKVFFDTASDMIHTDGLNKLTGVAHMIRQTPHWDYEVEGHADSRPIDTPEYDSNWDLAAARAVAVVEFLTKYNEVDPKQVSAVSYGAAQPEATNETAAGRAENRRIEISLAPDLDSLMDTRGIKATANNLDAVEAR